MSCPGAQSTLATPLPKRKYANIKALCWTGMTDTEHSKTSGSNEEDRNLITCANFGIGGHERTAKYRLSQLMN